MVYGLVGVVAPVVFGVKLLVNWEGNNILITDPTSNWPLKGVVCVTII